MGFGLKTTTGIIAAVLVMAALAQASTVFAPLAAALFIIAIVWPIQKQLQSWMPKLAALAITIIATVAICLGFASLAAWGFGRVGQSLLADLARYQALYAATVNWLDGHGVSVAGLWAEHFNVSWLLRATAICHRTGEHDAQLLGDCLGLRHAGASRSREHQAKHRTAG
ncbi:putative PurR-regulated permease PerM [Bradyrhizobium sp. AZCC 1577]